MKTARMKGVRRAHPDDFFAITVCLEFRAKTNPTIIDPMPIDGTVEWSCTEAPPKAVIILQQVIDAIREKRLYGFMMQESAKNPVGSKEWIAKTLEDLMTEEKALLS
jgi:hypothetical protein